MSTLVSSLRKRGLWALTTEARGQRLVEWSWSQRKASRSALSPKRIWTSSSRFSLRLHDHSATSNSSDTSATKARAEGRAVNRRGFLA